MAKINLSLPEIDLLIWLIQRNEERGDYFGSEEAFFKRGHTVKKRLIIHRRRGTVCPACNKIHSTTRFYGFCCDGCFKSW